ncbi:hypothetical protein [Streptomyces sp. V3I7]|uniref:hypothetical protein n=1 Tax=Streptomyces sp. V3I7 TaxID=3042278 RepID=UPI002787D059|nr:hypothetical protein [Streptomyces sp. V3I7]MDQ0993040.1 hypothetical protein [Streptomyces sp. V3I7]
MTQFATETAYSTEAQWDAEYEPRGHATSSRGPWFGLSQDAAFAMAQCAALATDARLLGYAVARADRYGHSEYGRGELVRLMGVDAANVRRAIAKLKAAGVLAPEADARCLLMAYEFRGGGKTPNDPKRCSRHGVTGAATRELASVPSLPKQRDAALFALDLYRGNDDKACA